MDTVSGYIQKKNPLSIIERFITTSRFEKKKDTRSVLNAGSLPDL